ncbi:MULTISPECIES: glycerol-3-phosphate 1-O-acyltransferase PlsY [Oceanimonas]|uniref:Glycerol-3-phosphate acyltransferase n=1 Tax=Oceanimonas doudoroffii TaxID=84158 RepID=A0A233RJT6_9GAMM|nr:MULTISPECIES: glycerol-3-phosphate 1-O-acyltransferase PlsY [Oceanimonas]NHH99745.1 putative glycerol-3-phosphate acyltransferase [Oceanimonas sp. MB9]OXY83657.1 glycerol-3-phosphate acyltransferase [Oceanimonas doudoroffii]
MTALTLFMIILAYLGGSVSSAVLISRLYRLPDPRSHGSGNPGATNVLRTGNRSAAVWVLLLDILKGTLPVYLGWFLDISPLYLALIAMAACLGHMFPLFFHFRGGKGVATALGALLPLGMDMAGLLMLTWLVSLGLFGYSSLASLITALFAPLFVYFIKPEYTLAVALLSCLIIIRHHRNISRLYHHEETPILNRLKRNREK